MVEIGDVAKPEAAQYRAKKKIYFIRNLYLPKNATDKYKRIYNRYWKEVRDHLNRLEKAGKVSKIFCESIYMEGEESLKVISSMNMQLERIVQKKIDEGAELLPLEDKEIFGAYVDWNNCLMIVRMPEVYKKIYKFFKETVQKRLEHITEVLKRNTAEGQAVLLIMRDEDRKSLKLPDDIELFPIAPPTLDDLEHFLRDIDRETEYWRTSHEE